MTQNWVVAARAIMDSGGDISLSLASGITCPVLLIAGEHDHVAPPALAARLAARIRTVELLEAADSGHDVYPNGPEWLTQTVLDRLGKHA